MNKPNKRMKVDQHEEMELRLEGWGFDVDALRESEGALSSLDRRSPRAFSTNVSNDLPNLEDNRQGDNLPDGMSPNGNICNYSGLRSTESYMREGI